MVQCRSAVSVAHRLFSFHHSADRNADRQGRKGHTRGAKGREQRAIRGQEKQQGKVKSKRVQEAEARASVREAERRKRKGSQEARSERSRS